MSISIEAFLKENPASRMDGQSLMVNFDALYVETGFNIRDIDFAHVMNFRSSIINNQNIPALIVQIEERDNKTSLKVIDGHHRYYAYKIAIANGNIEPDTLIHVNEFNGSAVEALTLMVKSSEGRALSNLERAGAYVRMIASGASQKDIAEQLNENPAKVSTLIKYRNFVEENIEFLALAENNILTLGKINSYLTKYKDSAAAILAKEIGLDSLDLSGIENKPESQKLSPKAYEEALAAFEEEVSKIKKQIKANLAKVKNVKVTEDNIEEMEMCLTDLSDKITASLAESTGTTVNLKIDRVLAIKIDELVTTINEVKIQNAIVAKNRENIGLDKFEETPASLIANKDRQKTIESVSEDILTEEEDDLDLNNPDTSLVNAQDFDELQDPIYNDEDENQETYRD